MKLSILDQAPIAQSASPQAALQESLKLAQLAENTGYTRYWIAEHHDMPGLACSAPEVMLGYIGAGTRTIRIGAGAILLPHYKPYKVAETFNLLAALFPGRIDLGIGRAPGGSAEATMALSDNFLENVRTMPQKLKELLCFLHNDFPVENMFSKIKASPIPAESPEVWLLGTSEKSGKLAAQSGIAYAFGQFMSDKDGAEILKGYRDSFQPKYELKQSKSILTVNAVCAETAEKAKEMASSAHLWRMQQLQGVNRGVPTIDEAKAYTYSPEEQKMIEAAEAKMVIGNPSEVKKRLLDIERKYGADELMIVTITHSYEDRLKSYKLIADEMGEMMK
ncbi:LLM class flavin-dependent oxidoreductase [Peribacillus frigoritolerans]|uniref:LLM class flavin-dependent oxidoreductase n=1 Tax=Peribacillus frigoritolerans TaxID=450367 RepID=UPI00105963B7|nr:LLM class flavin-dependent oxidoreductase [Peribacillus frigoritolerans]TDL81013.1 LLM class flavin-dependent oxidoreductase [Peribacillus frigoritolerans]